MDWNRTIVGHVVDQIQVCPGAGGVSAEVLYYYSSSSDFSEPFARIEHAPLVHRESSYFIAWLFRVGLVDNMKNLVGYVPLPANGLTDQTILHNYVHFAGILLINLVG
jgi:hypothetical protein